MLTFLRHQQHSAATPPAPQPAALTQAAANIALSIQKPLFELMSQKQMPSPQANTLPEKAEEWDTKQVAQFLEKFVLPVERFESVCGALLLELDETELTQDPYLLDRARARMLIKAVRKYA